MRHVGLGSLAPLLWCLAASGCGVSGHPSAPLVQDCSSLVLDNRGQAIFACNYDRVTNDPGLVFIHRRGVVKTGFRPSTTEVVAHWTARYASVAFSLLGYQHAWAGMNEGGLVLSTMALDQTVNEPADHRPPLDWLWPQYLLDTCETVQDVIATESLVRTYTVDHYLVADRYGGVAVIEFLDGQMEVHTGSELCATALTNSVYSLSCELWERYRPTRDYERQGDSIERFCLAADRISSFEGTTTEGAVDYAFTTLRGIYRRGLDRYTRWSIVFDTTNLRATFKTQRNPQLRWVDLEAFDLRCRGPALMLDMDVPAAGDVSDRFTEVDSDRNHAFMEGYYQRQNIDFDPVAMQMILQHVEGFPCQQQRRIDDRRLVPAGTRTP